jgi:hypothetical protein
VIARKLLVFVSSLLSTRSRDEPGTTAETAGRRFHRSTGMNGTNGYVWTSPDQTHDIFEGTEQIQQLVISRAISGMRIE